MANLRNLAVRMVLLFFLFEIRSALETEKGVTNYEGQGSCGVWTNYLKDKCLIIADKAGPQTKEEAEIICRALGDTSSKLITIKSKEEQEFLEGFLFEKNQMVDDVWLGLTKIGNGSFHWPDGSELSFTNWANQTLGDFEHDCVQMESGNGSYKTGLWVAVNCTRKNAVVCEKRPTWTFAMLQDAFLSFKFEEEMKRKELEEKLEESVKQQNETKMDLSKAKEEGARKFQKLEMNITTLSDRDEINQQDINTLMKTTVPVGFIYVQLPGQAPPSTLWPSTKWIEVSSNYSGLFFRVVGGQAAPFGIIQGASTTRLEGVDKLDGYELLEIVVPSDGSWSKAIITGGHTGMAYSLRFRLSKSEIRPRNQAVKIWKRIS